MLLSVTSIDGRPCNLRAVKKRGRRGSPRPLPFFFDVALIIAVVIVLLRYFCFLLFQQFVFIGTLYIIHCPERDFER